jgi:Putative cyclase
MKTLPRPVSRQEFERLFQKLSNWGRWGPDDERGALNLLGPASVLRALSLPREGRVLDLSYPIQARGVPMITSRPAPVHTFTVDGGDYAVGGKLSNGCGSAEDHLFLHLHGHTTHLDSLGHVWTGEQLYNGYSSLEIRSSGMRRLGIEHVGHVLTRGLLLDLPRLRGVPHLPAGEEVGAAELERALEALGVAPEPGDAVLVRTGWNRVHAEDPARWERSWPGIGVEAAAWLAARDPVLVGGDTPAVEVSPFRPGTTAPVHQLLLRDHGIYLMELMDLDALAEAAPREFLFVAAPLRLRGGTGSPLNPLAVL